MNTNMFSYTVFHGVVVITADGGLCFINLCIFLMNLLQLGSVFAVFTQLFGSCNS